MSFSQRPYTRLFALALTCLISAPSARADNPPTVTFFDSDPKHPWNHLYEALLARIEAEELEDPDELDPFLIENSPYRPFPSEHSPYREAAKRRSRAKNALDEFIAAKGETLITDPRKRAILQRDLWAFFDMTAQPRALVTGDEEIELATRAGKMLQRVALSAEQIGALPDNFDQAIQNGTFPQGLELSRLWETDGPWVLLGSQELAPAARTHAEVFGGRSAFFVFMRVPGGREQALKCLSKLQANPNVRQIPGVEGAQFALVRQMMLIDNHGRIVVTPVVESVQVRGQGMHKFKLNRQEFIAGKPSLKALAPDDRERDFILFLRRNAGHERSKVLVSCTGCHKPDELQSHVRDFPPGQYVKANLQASKWEDETLHARGWKASRYEWGLLQGLIAGLPRE